MEQQQPKICLENIIKIYGEQPQMILPLLRQGYSSGDILAETGHVVSIAEVSLRIQPGELFVIMGLSGSGKSTLIRCINRLVTPTSGQVLIDGEDIVHVSKERLREIRLQKVAMVFQQFGLFPHKTVAENVEYGLKMGGMAAVPRREKALAILERVGLRQWADYRPAALSGGMQQRVGLARAIATDAEILLMDEPFSALDPLIRREMQQELLRLQEEFQQTIVFISHDIYEALKIGDRLALMKEGKLVQVGTPQEILTQPADDYVRAFIQDVKDSQRLTESLYRS